MLRHDHAFTLLEVLLGVVLLAIVIGICAPFLSITPSQDRQRSQSEFVLVAEQLISAAQSSDSQLLGYEDYAAIALAQGWGCERVGTSVAMGRDDQPLGEWVLLSDGLYQMLCWAAIHPAGEEGT